MSARILTVQDTPALLAFLEARAATSLFLLSNLATQGISPGDGTVYAATVDSGGVRGVVSRTARGIVLVQADREVDVLARLSVGTAPVNGVIGPTAQVSSFLDALDLGGRPVRMHSDERLYELELGSFSSTHPTEAVRLATADDVDAVAALRRPYLIEALGAPDDSALDAAARAEAERMSIDGATFVLEEAGSIVSMTTFSARYGRIVQVGGVYTPPALRRGGRGRVVVAGSLLHAKRAWSAERAVLFTAEKNLPAQRAYEALGFVRTGGFTLHFFSEVATISSGGSS